MQAGKFDWSKGFSRNHHKRTKHINAESMKVWGNSYFIGSFFLFKPNSIPSFTEKYSKTSEKILTSTYPVIYNKIPFSESYNWISNVLEMELRHKSPNACGTLRGSIAARRQKLFCTVSGGGAKKQYGFEFQSRYIEHHFETRAKLPPIFDVCVTAFVLPFTTEWPSEWDMILRWYEQSNAVWTGGRNDIRRERHIPCM